MGEPKPGGLAEWYRGFLTQRKSSRLGRLRERQADRYRKGGRNRKRLERIEQFGLCKTCQQASVTGGESDVAQEARKQDQCIDCFVGERRKKR